MMFEPDEKEVIDLEPAAETAPDPVAEGETPPAEAEETELVVSIGNEEPQPDPVAEEARQAPEWVKELRKQNREQQKRIRELERSMQAPAAQGETTTAPPKKPTLQDVDYDTGAYEANDALQIGTCVHEMCEVFVKGNDPYAHLDWSVEVADRCHVQPSGLARVGRW